MSGIRDVVFILVWLGLIPVSLVRPWIGVLVWYWLAFMVPHGLTWGFSRTLPVAMAIGGATLVGWLFVKERKPIPVTWTVIGLALMTIHFTITTVTAFDRELAFEKWVWVIKVLLMTFVTMTLFQDKVRLRWLYMVTALSLGFYGLKGGIWVFRTGGGERVYGPDMSFFADNNAIGLALCMILPMLLYLAREEPRFWLKRIMQVTFFFTTVAIIFTYSRGAFLGLAIILGVLIWRSPWRVRFAMTVVVCVLIAIPLLPQTMTERIESITDQQSEQTRDGSVQGRFEAWQTAWRIALDHPFTGGGFRTMWNPLVWLRYFDPNMQGSRSTDAHSLYFEVLGEHGFVGFGLYMMVLVSTLMSLRKIRKRWRGHPEYGYLANYAEMTQLCIYPFLVAGAFITVAYIDLYFYFIASNVMLGALAAQAEKAVAPTMVRGRAVAPPPVVVPVPAPVPALTAGERRRARALPPVRKRHA